jgi:hypothetical protein
MNSKTVGPLSPNEYDPEYFESKPFPIPYFDKKEIKVGFVEATFQEYMDSADKVLGNFLVLNSLDRIENSHMVYNYYSETLRHGYTTKLDIKTTKDIWNFVTSTDIIIHSGDDDDFYLCVSCECEWEEEHGLQLVFKDGRTLTRVGGQDGHLTD